MMFKRIGTTISIFSMVMFALAGCSTQPSATNQPSSNRSNLSNNTISHSNSTSGEGNLSTTKVPSPASQTMFNGNVQGVIDHIPQTSAHIQQTVNATIQGQPYGKGMQAVRFVSPSTGFLVGKGIVLKTTDGGRSFHTATQTNVDLQGVSTVSTPSTLKGSAKTVVAWGGDRVLISQDGGSSWKTDSLSTTKGNVQTVDFATSSEGFAVVGDGYRNGVVLRTTDGGAHWSKISVPSQTVSLSFGSPSVGWIGEANGSIYETQDSGKSWVQVFDPNVQTPGRPVVHAVSDHVCWAMIIGQSGMSQTSYSVFRTENGTNWKPVLGVGTAGAGPAPDNATHVPKGPSMAPGPMVALNAKQAVVPGVCRACGMGSAKMAATQNGGSNWSIYPTIPNGMSTPSSVSFVTISDGWVLDATPMQGSFLLHTIDGGRSWQEVYPMIHPHPVQGISFLNPKLGYGIGVPGNANAIVKTTDGGYTWRQVGTLPVHTTKNFYGMADSPIDFVTASLGYAVGPNGLVYKSKDGGQTWTQAKIPQLKAHMTSITFLNNGQDGLAVTYDHHAAVTVDGGQTWHTIQVKRDTQADLYLAGLTKSPLAATLKAMIETKNASRVELEGTQVAWVLGNNQETFSLTADGGKTWHNIDFGQRGQRPTPWSIDFVNRQDGWAIGTFGSLLRTTDGGKTWVHASHVRLG